MKDATPPLATLGVIGPGLMGLGIARVAARAGVVVWLLGRDAASAAAGRERLLAALRRDVARGRLAADDAERQLERVHAAAEVDALSGCALVVESVPEQRALKLELLQRVQRVMAADAILASNTSGLPITGLAAALPRPQAFLGLHFFSPAERMRLVEVVRGAATASAVLARALAWVRQLGQQPIVVRDGPGFFTSRVFAAYLDEAVAMVGEGVDVAAIDAAALGLGRAIGPLALLDDIGLGLNLQQALQAEADGLPPRHCRPLARPVFERLLAAGRGGRRHGGGFYDHAADGTRRPWAALTTDGPAPPVAQLQQRLRWAEVLEALRCLEEGVITSADDADTGSVLGLGFPAAAGGLLRWAEAQGLEQGLQQCEALARVHGPRFEPTPWMREQARSGRGLAAWREHLPAQS